MSIRSCLFALLLPLFASAHAWADPLYTFDFLPAGFAPSALNNSGQIVGTYGGAAAILSGGTITSLGSVLPDSYGLAINNRGDIAGAQYSPYSGSAFAYVGGSVVPVAASLPDTYAYSNARGINDTGMVAGNGQPYIGEAQRGFLYDSGGIHLIGTFGGDWSYAAAINASGAVAGTATLPSSSFDRSVTPTSTRAARCSTSAPWAASAAKPTTSTTPGSRWAGRKRTSFWTTARCRGPSPTATGTWSTSVRWAATGAMRGR